MQFILIWQNIKFIICQILIFLDNLANYNYLLLENRENREGKLSTFYFFDFKSVLSTCSYLQ
ncbi:MAG: hypothetical protein EAZ32_00645 [Cytophagia bacterium]|nr:MAG: hypothetical protein EAZ38_03085 [Cytophagales bacterium]TAG42837.1 MAG: hypothetical protein EAZ32_00645 [Cytophagia bacterium]TAG76377.1 MAG: hypothetical protein EAZ22_18285 [Cytophagales bacterium]